MKQKINLFWPYDELSLPGNSVVRRKGTPGNHVCSPPGTLHLKLTWYFDKLALLQVVRLV